MMERQVISLPACAPGIGIGTAQLISEPNLIFSKHVICDQAIAAAEVARFQQAVKAAAALLQGTKDRLQVILGAVPLQIIDSHILLIQDETIVETTSDFIRNELINAEWALEKTVDQLKRRFVQMKDPYLEQRIFDIDHIGRRLLHSLMGNPKGGIGTIKFADAILVAHDFSPADISTLPRHRVNGLVAARGGSNSHAAIMARALQIPYMAGLDRAPLLFREGDALIIDGENGRIIRHPTPAEKRDYEKKRNSDQRRRQSLLKDAHLPAVTADGRTILLMANIELLEELPAVQDSAAEGIGLFRTEFMFLNQHNLPTEEELFQYYKGLAEKMAPLPVTIRTLDLGNDTLYSHYPYATQRNPELGLRGIRLSLKESSLFISQVRAILKASPYGKLQLCIPMVTTVAEIRQVKALIQKVENDLRRDGVPFDPALPIGIMIEVPSAAMIADLLAREVDFFSIGTNDLIQYTLAVDRTNDLVRYLYDPTHPAILRMLRHTLQAAEAAKIEVTLCGEMAGDPNYVDVVIGLGFTRLSMSPHAIPPLKQRIRALSFGAAEKIASKAAGGESP